MLYLYKALDLNGTEKSGTIDAVTVDVAIESLQKRGLILAGIEPADKDNSIFKNFSFGNKVSTKDVVILSQQMSTLFEAQVSALKIFSLLASEAENMHLRKSLVEVTDDLKAGSSISNALGKHPEIFSDFYVNMVRAGEETGKLDETFKYLAEYLDRNYEVVSKTKNALIYPAFVITVFIAVMILMFTIIIPKIGTILKESGQDIPVYTKVVFGISNFLVNYGLLFAAALIVLGFFSLRYARTDEGREAWGRFQLEIPYVGDLYKKLYLSLIADNMNTMIYSGISMTRALEVTASVVGNDIYKNILEESLVAVKGGSPLSQALSQYDEIPGIFTQMVKVGEETGELGSILKTMARFYQREVINAVDTLVSLIEPVMIVLLGLGVGTLLASVLIPIYNIANSAGS